MLLILEICESGVSDKNFQIRLNLANYVFKNYRKLQHALKREKKLFRQTWNCFVCLTYFHCREVWVIDILNPLIGIQQCFYTKQLRRGRIHPTGGSLWWDQSETKHHHNLQSGSGSHPRWRPYHYEAIKSDELSCDNILKPIDPSRSYVIGKL